MKNAKQLLHKLDYLPRWAWYAMSLAVGGPIGPVVVYVVFHAPKPRTMRTRRANGVRVMIVTARPPTRIIP